MLGAELRKTREDRGWSGSKVADGLGVTPGFVSLAERDKRGVSPALLERWLDLLEVQGAPRKAIVRQWMQSRAGPLGVRGEHLAETARRLTLEGKAFDPRGDRFDTIERSDFLRGCASGATSVELGDALRLIVVDSDAREVFRWLVQLDGSRRAKCLRVLRTMKDLADSFARPDPAD